MRRRLKSTASRLFTQPFIQARIKEGIKAPRHWPLCGEFTGDRWIRRQKWPETRKMFPFDDVIMLKYFCHVCLSVYMFLAKLTRISGIYVFLSVCCSVSFGVLFSSIFVCIFVCCLFVSYCINFDEIWQVHCLSVYHFVVLTTFSIISRNSQLNITQISHSKGFAHSSGKFFGHDSRSRNWIVSSENKSPL